MANPSSFARTEAYTSDTEALAQLRYAPDLQPKIQLGYLGSFNALFSRTAQLFSRRGGSFLTVFLLVAVPLTFVQIGLGLWLTKGESLRELNSYFTSFLGMLLGTLLMFAAAQAVAVEFVKAWADAPRGDFKTQVIFRGLAKRWWKHLFIQLVMALTTTVFLFGELVISRVGSAAGTGDRPTGLSPEFVVVSLVFGPIVFVVVHLFFGVAPMTLAHEKLNVWNSIRRAGKISQLNTRNNFYALLLHQFVALTWVFIVTILLGMLLSWLLGIVNLQELDPEIVRRIRFGFDTLGTLATSLVYALLMGVFSVQYFNLADRSDNRYMKRQIGAIGEELLAAQTPQADHKGPQLDG